MQREQETHVGMPPSILATSAVLSSLVAAQEPESLAEDISTQLRELLGAQTVALLHHTNGLEPCRILACAPKRRHALLANVAAWLCPHGPLAAQHHDPMAWKQVPELLQKLAPAGISSLSSIPLQVGGVVVGSLILANLARADRAGEIRELTDQLAPLLALALQNASARQAMHQQNTRLEEWVEERTQQLAESNARLRDSRAAALNMMEDAVLAKERLDVTQFALDHAADAVIWIRENGSLAYANQAACNILQFRMHDLMQLTVEQFCEDYAPGSWQETKLATSLQFEGIWLASTGQRVPVEVHASYMRYGDQEYVCSFVSDISARKKAERALAESQRRVQTLIDNLPGVAYRCASTERYTMEYVSDGIVALTGYTPEELVDDAKLSFVDIIHPEDRKMVWEKVQAHLLLKTPFEMNYRILTREDTIKWVWEQGRGVYDEHGCAVALEGLINDVSQSVRQQEELAASESRFRSLMEQSPLAIAIYTPDGTLHSANDAWESRLGHYVADGDQADRPYNILADPLTTELGIEDSVVRAFMGQEVVIEAVPYPSKASASSLGNDGIRWIRSRFSPIKDGDDIRSVVCTSEDLTLERQRDADQRRLLSAIEQAAEAVIITNREAEIIYVSPAFEGITGYSASEVLGHNPRFLQSGEHEDAFFQSMWDTLAAGETWRGRLVNRRKDGSRYMEDAVIAPVLDRAGSIVNYVAVKRDITEELRLEEQLRQAQKMEAVGRLAGGVAHDFNNMLSVILGHAEMLRMDTDEGDPIYSSLVEISDAGERSAKLTKQLLAFARQQTISPEVLDLNEAVSGMLNMLARLIGEDISLEWVPAPDLWLVNIDPGQVDQLMANLCVNARDAIADVGKIAISTNNATLDDAFCADNVDAIPGEYVRLRVTDTGSGMDEEVLNHLFEPFFTTKAIGKGTGLGLATVYGAVTQNGGCIDVQSQVGVGSTFDIYLPRHTGADASSAYMEENGPGETGQETLLVVEDEPAILKMAKMMLEGMGYHVIPAATPMAAILEAENHRGRLDLMLTDVIMPEMNGRDLARRLQRDRPNLRCLFMSGYTADVIAHHGVLDSKVAFLPKPYTATQLGRAVREALDDEKG